MLIDKKAIIFMWIALVICGIVSTAFQQQLLVRVAFVCIPLIVAFIKRNEIISALYKRNNG